MQLSAVSSAGPASISDVNRTENPMRIVIVGHVDHGKSTLIGRLFHDTGRLPEGRLEAIEASCARRGVPFEWAYLMDALQSERDQNITIESAQIWFASAIRRYVIIDAPGHVEFLRNMVTGAASADAAILMVAADEGLRDQTRRHAQLLKLLGIRNIVVAVNKCDAIGFDAARFDAVADGCTRFLAGLGLAPRAVVPLAARSGDNLVTRSEHTPWYRGPTVLEALDAFPTPAVAEGLALRFAVQDVYRFDARRIIAGRVESGTLRAGDRVRFYPGGEARTVARIVSWPERDVVEAHAGQSVGFVLEDQIFVERGHVAAHEDAAPQVGTGFAASVFWMGHRPLRQGARYRLRLLTQEVECTIVAVPRVLDLDGAGSVDAAPRIERHGVGEIIVATATPLAFDVHASGLASGRFVLLDGLDIAGGGIITRADDDADRHAHADPARVALASAAIETFICAVQAPVGTDDVAAALAALFAPHGIVIEVVPANRTSDG